MEEETSGKFGIIDYCVFIGMLVFSGAIGLYSSYKGNKSPEEFLMGNRSFKPLPVAMSLLTSYISAISVLGYSGEIYAYGAQLCIFALGALSAVIFATHFVLPLLYPLKLTSINEYLEMRFKSKLLMIVISVLSVAKSMLYMGFLLYAPTIALVSVTNLSILSYIILLGIICTLYSAFGGIRAVIWTDVFQLAVMLIGMALVFVIGTVENGGFIKILSISNEGGRLDMFNMDPSPFTRHTFFNTYLLGLFGYGYIYCAEQVNIQRMCAVKSIEDARTMMRYKLIGIIIIYFLINICGLVAYATYAGCDPMALGIIKRKEEILTYYISDKLGFIPGLPGIFIATLVGATLSSLSSTINACVANIWRDVCLRYSFFKSASSRVATLTSAVLSMIVGSILTGLAVLASNSPNLIEYSLTVGVSIGGPILGVFLVAYFFPKCNLKGVWTGFFASSVMTIWLSIGALLYKRRTDMLPFSAEECLQKNNTYYNETFANVIGSSVQRQNVTSETIEENNFLISVYQLSYTLYAVISPTLCASIAVIVSFITGNQDIKEVSPAHICPSLHRFYWSKEELEKMRDNQIELVSCSINNMNVDEKEHEENDKMINDDVKA